MDAALIAAMDEEVVALREKLTSAQRVEVPLAELPIYQGQLQDLDTVIVQCGIGKVNAALATQYTIDHFKPKVIITSGVAGAVSPKIRVGDVIIATAAQQHDFDVRGFGYPVGVIPRLSSSLFPADHRLVELAAAAAGKLNARTHQGLVVSGDAFICSQEQKDEILKHFPEALCADMEAAAIAQVAALNGIPFLILETISDQADDEAEDVFYETLPDVLAGLNSVIEELLGLLRTGL